MNDPKFDLEELSSHLSGHWISDLANFSAYVFQKLPDLNWAGFYISDGKELRLGPFMGKPACQRIRFGQGVCGQAFQNQKFLIVDDVDAFPGHIRCDADSRSEMVIPFFIHGEIQGVLDLDSPSLARFQSEDLKVIEQALNLLSQSIESNPAVSFGKLKVTS